MYVFAVLEIVHVPLPSLVSDRPLVAFPLFTIPLIRPLPLPCRLTLCVPPALLVIDVPPEIVNRPESDWM